MDKIHYINNGAAYRPETIKLGSGPDGGLTIYCYNDMPLPPEETELVVDGEYVTERDSFAAYNRVRYMQCAVRLSAEETNEILLTLMTMTDKRSLSILRKQIRELDPHRAQALQKALTDSIQYLFPESGLQAREAEDDPIIIHKQMTTAELNQYLDQLNRQKK